MPSTPGAQRTARNSKFDPALTAERLQAPRAVPSTPGAQRTARDSQGRGLRLGVAGFCLLLVLTPLLLLITGAPPARHAQRERERERESLQRPSQPADDCPTTHLYLDTREAA